MRATERPAFPENGSTWQTHASPGLWFSNRREQGYDIHAPVSRGQSGSGKHNPGARHRPRRGPGWRKGEQEGTEIPTLIPPTHNLANCGPKGDQSGWSDDSAGSSQDCTEHALGECVRGCRPYIPQPLPSPSRGCTPAGSRSRLAVPKAIWVTKGLLSLELWIFISLLPRDLGPPLLHSSFQLAQGTSQAELSDPRDPSPAHGGILVSGFTVVPASKTPVSASRLQPTPPEPPSGQFLGSLKASEAREGLRGPMRGDAPEQVVDPPGGSLGCTLGFPPLSQIKHGQNIHLRSPGCQRWAG